LKGPRGLTEQYIVWIIASRNCISPVGTRELPGSIPQRERPVVLIMKFNKFLFTLQVLYNRTTMSHWAQNRRILILSGIFMIFAVIGFAVYTFVFFKPPTCFDGLQNGIEEGIDCGGTCKLVCSFQATEPNILWSRAFKISDGVYNITGLIENPNFDVKLDGTYKFEAYNSENLLIEEVFGDVTVYPAEKKPIFEATVLTGFQDISRVLSKAEQLEQSVFVTSRSLENTDTDPKLEVELVNRGIVPKRNLSVTAVLHDATGNVVQSEEITKIEVYISEIELF